MEIVLIAALTLDGRLTRAGETGVQFSSPEDQAHLKAKLRLCDASIMGAGTYRLHREQIRSRAPANRLRLIWTRNPATFVGEALPGSLEFLSGNAEDLVARLRSADCKRCALMGGSEVYGQFLEANLVTELCLTYEPELSGTGLPLASIPLLSRWKLLESKALNRDTYVVQYVRDVQPPASPRRRIPWGHLIGYFWLWVFGLIAVGAVLGTVLFPVLGPLFGAKSSALQLAKAGAKFGSFYFMIWAPGVALVVTFMRGYKKAGPR